MPIQKTHLGWLVGCPASDLNFKNHVAEANLETCEAALENTTLTKTARAAIEARLRKLTKLLPRPAAHQKAGASAADPALANKSAPGKSHSVEPFDYMRGVIRGEVAKRCIPEKEFAKMLDAQTLGSLDEDAEMEAFDGVLDAVKAWKSAKGVRTITLSDLDVMPPVRRVGRAKPVTLEVLETQIRDFLAEDERREVSWKNESVYDRMAIGLCLLKGREIHAQKGGRPKTVEPVSAVSKTALKAEQKIDEGFIAWIEEQFPTFSTRTARNYMNGARNCGLTSDHGLEDVDALRTAQALHGKTAKELYTLADALKTPALPDAPEPRQNLVMEAQRDLFAALDQMIVLRDDRDCDDAVFETTTTRLHATLEKWTGATWIMGTENHAAQHGDLHGDGRAAGKSKKSKVGSKEKGARK